MALKIRLARIGAKNNPHYHVVVKEARSRRDGAAVEILGTYSPAQKKNQLTLDVSRADYWVSVGATPSDTAKSLIKRARKEAPAVAPVVEAAPVDAAPAPVAS